MLADSVACSLESHRQAEGLNWEHPYFDNFNSAFNPQTTINRENVRSLELKWTCELAPANFQKKGAKSGSRTSRPSRVQTIALVIGGNAFVADGNNVVYSVDAKTGSPRWSFAAPLEGKTDVRTGPHAQLPRGAGLPGLVELHPVRPRPGERGASFQDGRDISGRREGLLREDRAELLPRDGDNRCGNPLRGHG